jgi:hypothetical protein
MKINFRLVLLASALLLSVVGAQAAIAPKAVPVKQPAAAVKAAPALKFNDKASLAIKKTATDFIKNYLVSDGTAFTVAITAKTNSLYFLSIKIGGNEVQSAITADGKYFFPQALNIKDYLANAKQQGGASASAAAPAATAPRADKPLVELFVMSYCPYGAQMEKGILPVVKALGASIDFQLKFVNYTMHGDRENQENLTQYCINQTAPTRLLTYLDCFLLQADSTSCLSQANIDQAAITACTAAVSKQYDVSGTNFSIYDADNKKYGVQSSPTLVINGQTADTNRDSASLAKVICAAFTAGHEPAACAQIFSSATPAPGFGSGTTTNSTPASCN